jgi:hypothetical protein
MLMAYGMTTILVYGSIFSRPRKWITEHSTFFGALIACILCTSTWVGFFLSLVLGSVSAHYFPSIFPVNLFMDGMMTAGSVWAINSVIEFFEENRINKNNIL